MTVTTDIYWEADGVTLNTLRWNISTKGGNRFTGPPRRGENQKMPFVEGRRYVPKLRDSRIITLQMWVRGCDDNGVFSALYPASEGFDRNWTTLLNLFQQDGQYELVKRIRDTDGTVVAGTGMVEWIGGMEPEVAPGGAKANFEVDLLMADPWFYSGATPLTMLASPESLAGIEFSELNVRRGVVEVKGDRPTTKVLVRTDDYVKIGNRFIGYTGKGTATIDCTHRQVISDGRFENNKVKRDYVDRTWLTLTPGVHKFEGSGEVLYQAAWA